MGVRSLSKALEGLPRREELLAAMKPATREAMNNPSSARWHDGDVVLDSAKAVDALLGREAVEEMSYQAVKKSMGPVMEPFLRVSLALFGTSPSTIYKRMNDSLKTVMQNVTASWAPRDEHSGTLTISHPDDVPEVSWASWKGSLRYVFDLCGAKDGTLVARQDLATPKTLVFECSWK